MRGTGRTTLLVYTVLGYSSGFRCGPVSDAESPRAADDGAAPWTTRIHALGGEFDSSIWPEVAAAVLMCW
jgi:hypothetical protein